MNISSPAIVDVAACIPPSNIPTPRHVPNPTHQYGGSMSEPALARAPFSPHFLNVVRVRAGGRTR